MGRDPSGAQCIVEGPGARACNPRGPIEPKESAQEAVRHLLGVNGAHNQIVVKPRASAAEVKPHIEAAFRRRAGLDAQKIRVEIQDGKLVLRGELNSWAERREAERTAWAVPGITRVENLITVTPWRT
jgi:osmotically-inducible protein OsmY